MCSSHSYLYTGDIFPSLIPPQKSSISKFPNKTILFPSLLRISTGYVVPIFLLLLLFLVLSRLFCSIKIFKVCTVVSIAVAYVLITYVHFVYLTVTSKALHNLRILHSATQNDHHMIRKLKHVYTVKESFQVR